MESLYVASNNETIPDFAAIIVHEVRNPLTSIKLSARVITGKRKDNDIHKYLDIISKSAQRIDELISELLKPSSRRRDFKETISIHELLDEVIQQADDRLLLKQVGVTREYNIQDIELSVNKAQLKIAFTNIIINAIDAVAPKTGKLKLVTKSTDDNYIVHIEDNGCGIKPENLNNIFKPYFTDKPDGLGLGLTATQKILHSNDIEIIVGSKLGDGTIFTLLFSKNNPDEDVESTRFDGMTIVHQDT
jgi:signal transduction histidine kinase